MKNILLDNSPVHHFFVIDEIQAVRGPHVGMQEPTQPGRPPRHHHTITVILKHGTSVDIRYGLWRADEEIEALDIINDNMAMDFETIMNALRYS